MKRLRLAFGVFAVLLCVGAALGSALTTGGHPPARPLHLSAKSGDPDAGSKKDTASVERGPAVATAAEEAYAQRAYPAAEVSLQATLDAQQAWSGVKQRSKGKNKAGQWTLMGPSSSNMPGLLVFSGADYTTSGRITALALDPNCSVSKCRLWVGAAGGGIWRTDQALNGSPPWEFVSGGLPTNAIGTLTYDAATGTLYAGTGEPNASADSETGSGLFRSTDGGDTWTHLPAVTTTTISGNYTGDAFANRAIESAVVDPTDPDAIIICTHRSNDQRGEGYGSDS